MKFILILFVLSYALIIIKGEEVTKYIKEKGYSYKKKSRIESNLMNIKLVILMLIPMFNIIIALIVTFIDSDDILEKAIENEKVYKIDMFW